MDDHVLQRHLITAGFSVPGNSQRSLDHDPGRTAFVRMAVFQNPERMALAYHGIWTGRLFHPAFI